MDENIFFEHDPTKFSSRIINKKTGQVPVELAYRGFDSKLKIPVGFDILTRNENLRYKYLYLNYVSLKFDLYTAPGDSRPEYLP